MAFCVKCGADRGDGRFCPMCGADNQPAAAAQPTPTPAPQPTYAAPAPVEQPAYAPQPPYAAPVAPQPKKSKKGLWIALAILAVLLVVGVVLLFVFQPWNAGQSKETNCDYCGTHSTCRSITYQGETGWFCNNCYDWVNSMVNGSSSVEDYLDDYDDYLGDYGDYSDYLDDYDYGNALDQYNDFVQDYSNSLGDYSDYLSDYL